GKGRDGGEPIRMPVKACPRAPTQAPPRRSVMSRVAQRCAAVILVAGTLSAAATLNRASAVTTPDSATPAISSAAAVQYTASWHAVYGGRDLVTLLEPTPVATPIPTPVPTPAPARVPAPRPTAV